ncbi:DUF1493 family protein [Citrobacter freundii]|uniref:DUF1493 family protein n=1 Tax=Citrobacter freundii complex TaxID=1344959 RepID=UPI0015EA75FE|nr:DUF1493 family protein [Citrobacter freundii]QLR79678.1 DUF1493 family protein [Citrobacter freundii]
MIIKGTKHYPHDSLGPVILAFLRAARFSEKEIVTCKYSTRLFHDLNLFGDTAEDVLELLKSEFGVNMSQFKFYKYFPKEFSKDVNYIDTLDVILLFRLNFLFKKYYTVLRKKVKCVYKKYLPVTLCMIEASIKEKKWVDFVE